MLLEISIKNFAIIEEVSLNFEQGMTVLTGETGAGKSIIIDAMNMMLGSRATTDVIRHGAPKAEIEGMFAIEQSKALIEIFEQQGLDMTDELIIRREIFQNGRSISRINAIGWTAFGGYSWSARPRRVDAFPVTYCYVGRVWR